MSQDTLTDLVAGHTITTRFGDNFRIVQPIGAGKNAAAFLALQTSGINAGSFCALKVLQNTFGTRNLRRFQAEIQALSRLQHPSILRILDSGYIEANKFKHPFYLCEYYEETLATAMRRGLSLPLKLAFAMQLVAGIVYLEKQHVVHCDIKPDKICVRGFDCALADFGLVRFQSTHGENAIGPSLHHYRSPDIVNLFTKGSEITTKSDVFQLGLVLVELFTGKNVCNSATSGNSPVVLDPLPSFHGTIGLKIRELLTSMLNYESTLRPNASDLIENWQMLLFECIQHRNVQEVRIF